MIIIPFLFLSFTLATKETTCVRSEGPKALKCLQKLHDIFEIAESVNIPEREIGDGINMLCKDVHTCEHLKCEAKEEVQNYVDKVTSYCEAIQYLTVDFKSCESQLTVANSTCFQKFDPFPDAVDDPAEMEEIQNEACATFFGKDNCMEKEITETCNVDVWTSFKKHYLALNIIMDACENLE